LVKKIEASGAFRSWSQLSITEIVIPRLFTECLTKSSSSDQALPEVREEQKAINLFEVFPEGTNSAANTLKNYTQCSTKDVMAQMK